MSHKAKILILGGGFGGLYTALELEKALNKESNVEVTLVNRENFFLFTPMLHEVAASDLDITTIVNPIRKLLKRTNFFDGEVRSIDLIKKQVVVFHGVDLIHQHELSYDHLVLALGSVTNFYGISGLEERALTMKSLADAVYLRNRLLSILRKPISSARELRGNRFSRLWVQAAALPASKRWRLSTTFSAMRSSFTPTLARRCCG
jgi:NADH dehydrogenase